MPGTPEGVDAAQLREFLASAPEELRSWADEHLASLTTEAGQRPAPSDEVGLEAFAEFTDDEPLLGRGNQAALPAAVRRPQGVKVSGKPKANKINLILVALLDAAVVIIVQQTGRTAEPGTVQPSALQDTSVPTEATDFPPLDEELAAELKAQAEADPGNVQVLRDIGKLYFDSGLYQDAVGYFEQALQVAPDDVEVLLSIGVAEYSVNNFDAAEQHWLRAAEVAPDKAEPWYNLGFLYMAKTPPDYAGVEKAWGRVVELAPDTEMAQTAETHLERFRNASASPSAGR